MTPEQPPNKPTIDERLEAVTQSLELAIRETQDMKAEIRRLDMRERRAREALLTGIAAYLRALNEDNGRRQTGG
jgi:hypothetical protein